MSHEFVRPSLPSAWLRMLLEEEANGGDPARSDICGHPEGSNAADADKIEKAIAAG